MINLNFKLTSYPFCGTPKTPQRDNTVFAKMAGNLSQDTFTAGNQEFAKKYANLPISCLSACEEDLGCEEYDSAEHRYVKSLIAAMIKVENREYANRHKFVNVTLKHASQGDTPVCITKEGAGYRVYSQNGDNLGEMILQKASGAKFYPDSKNRHNCLEVRNLWTKNAGSKASPYEGIGTQLMKQAVLESKKQGYGGRIILEAQNCALVPPTPFYYKSGLRFLESEKNEKMEKYLTEGGNLEGIEMGTMYLPDENIQTLLNNEI